MKETRSFGQIHVLFFILIFLVKSNCALSMSEMYRLFTSKFDAMQIEFGFLKDTLQVLDDRLTKVESQECQCTDTSETTDTDSSVENTRQDNRRNTNLMTLLRKTLSEEKSYIRAVEKRMTDSVAMVNVSLETLREDFDHRFETFSYNLETGKQSVRSQMSTISERQRNIESRVETIASLELDNLTQKVQCLEDSFLNIEQNTEYLDSKLTDLEAEHGKLNQSLQDQLKTLQDLLENGGRGTTVIESTTATPTTDPQTPLSDTVRLVNGSNSASGRVEVYSGGVWGTVCDDNWSDEDARVVCRMLGLPGGIARTEAYYGQGTGQIMLDDMNCVGTENNLFACDGNRDHNCGHSEDAGVTCQDTVRLVNGSNSASGRVEVYSGGVWGTVCDDNWSDEDARVVCRMLGLPGGMARTEAYYGQGTGQILLDDMNCVGTENNLFACDGNRDHNCGHSEDAGVTCQVATTEPSPGLSVRLVNGPNSASGRVEVYSGGVWGTVCDDNWSDEDARVVCRMLGLFGGTSRTEAYYGQGTGQILLDDMNCTGMENSLFDCGGNRNHNCGHSEDAGVSCQGIRLVDGPNSFSGRVEVYLEGVWGTVCDDGWSQEDARVVCRMLKLPGGTPRNGGSYGQGTGRILLDDVACTGSETSLSDCRGNRLHNCQHSEDAGVSCDAAPRLRIVNGSNSHSGRLEVFLNGGWGTVCDDDFTEIDARVVCRQLGLGGGIVRDEAHYGQGSGAILMDDLGCSGNETSLFGCIYNTVANCEHTEDVGLECEPPVEGHVRLFDGDLKSGRVEIFHEGEWGTVCDDNWDQEDASVVCRQLGFRGGLPVTETRFGEGKGTIWMDDVGCDSSHTALSQCLFPGWGHHNCQHTEDAGVVCD